MVSAALPLTRLTRDAPMREKVYVQIERHHRRDELTVHLSLPLRAEDPREHALAQESGQPLLRVQYAVNNLDLAAERVHVWRLVRAAYEDGGLGAELRRKDRVGRLTDIELRSCLWQLAEAGDGVHRRLFGFANEVALKTGRPRALDEKIRAVLRAAFLEPRILHIAGDAPLFPWAFLYHHTTELDTFVPTTFTAAGFWGFRHEIQHEVPGTATALRLPSSPRILAAICPDLAGMPHGDAAGMLPRAEFVDDVVALREHLVDFEADCLYFCGHADHAPEPIQTTSWLALRGVKLTVAALAQRGGPQFRHEPVLVFLNGCQTGHLPCWDENTMAGYLSHCGDHRVCCVTTAAEVPAGLAGAFARVFWAGFLGDRLPLGAAVLAARQALLTDHNNPLGLLYEVIGEVDTHVRVAAEDDA